MTALCNQPKAFASDLGDDQSRYLFTSTSHLIGWEDWVFASGN